MSLTPVEIRHVRLGRGVGYKREAVDRLLADVVASFEDVWRERADLADKVEALIQDMARYKEMETILRSTLVSAESMAADLRERARREADVILGEARTESRSIVREAERERDALLQEARRVRALLSTALSSVAEAADGERLAEPAAASATQSAPTAQPAHVPAPPPPAAPVLPPADEHTGWPAAPEAQATTDGPSSTAGQTPVRGDAPADAVSSADGQAARPHGPDDTAEYALLQGGPRPSGVRAA